MFMGLAFTAVGGTLVFGRSWITLDATQRIVLKQWGWLVPMHAQTHRLEGYTAVRSDSRKGIRTPPTSFPSL